LLLYGKKNYDDLKQGNSAAKKENQERGKEANQGARAINMP